MREYTRIAAIMQWDKVVNATHATCNYVRYRSQNEAPFIVGLYFARTIRSSGIDMLNKRYLVGSRHVLLSKLRPKRYSNVYILQSVKYYEKNDKFSHEPNPKYSWKIK